MIFEACVHIEVTGWLIGYFRSEPEGAVCVWELGLVMAERGAARRAQVQGHAVPSPLHFQELLALDVTADSRPAGARRRHTQNQVDLALSRKASVWGLV